MALSSISRGGGQNGHTCHRQYQVHQVLHQWRSPHQLLGRCARQHHLHLCKAVQQAAA
jgi:hypothetical protein